MAARIMIIISSQLRARSPRILIQVTLLKGKTQKYWLFYS
jgi:hypothetical protein